MPWPVAARISVALGATAVVAVACSGREGASSIFEPAMTTFAGTCPTPNVGDQEEELFGVADIAVDGNAMLISGDITKPDTSFVPINREPACDDGGDGHDNHGDHFGWYATDWPALSPDYHCDDPERHRADGSFPAGTEVHCIGYGRFMLQLADNESTQRPLDFFGYWASSDTPGDTVGIPGVYRVEPISPASGQTPVEQDEQPMDIWVAYRVAGSLVVDPLLQLSPKPYPEVASELWESADPVGAQYHMPLNFDLRIHAAASTGWNNETLVRYSWSCCSDTSQANNTGFTNFESGATIVRTHRYGTAGSYVIRAHFAQPWERPVGAYSPTDFSYGVHEDITLNVTPPLTATIGYTGQLLVDNEVQFSAGGSNGGGGVEYFWQFGDGSGIDSTSGATAPHTYSSVGSRTVWLIKRDQYGYLSDTSLQVTVEEPPPPPVELIVSAVPNNSELSNAVKPNQTCLWLAQSNLDSTSFTWQRFMGVWKWVPPNNPLSLWTGSTSGSTPYRLIGSKPPQVDTFNFTITVTSAGEVCDGW